MYVNVHFDALFSFHGKRPVLSQARAFDFDTVSKSVSDKQ